MVGIANGIFMESSKIDAHHAFLLLVKVSNRPKITLHRQAE